MAKARTIDDLGIEASVQWANAQAFLDQSITRESHLISRYTEIDVYTPFYKSEFDLIFETKKRHQQWAAFFAPAGYSTQRMRLFLYQVIPSLGTEDFQLAQMQKIRNKCEDNKKKRAEEKQETNSSKYAWEDQRAEEEENKESKTLLALIEYVNTLDKLLIAINSRRSQYSKG